MGSWNFTGVTERHPGLLDYSNDWSVERNLAQFQAWKDQGVATGGFVWLFNDGYDETWDMNAWAAGLNRIFEAVTVPEDQVAIRCYSEKNHGGYCVALPEGRFHMGDLAVYGIKANDIVSIEFVNNDDKFYQAKFYLSPDCKGSYLLRRLSSKTLGNTYGDKVCSILIEPNPTGISSASEEEEETIYNLSGQRLQKMQKGINIVNGKKIMVQ